VQKIPTFGSNENYEFFIRTKRPTEVPQNSNHHTAAHQIEPKGQHLQRKANQLLRQQGLHLRQGNHRELPIEKIKIVRVGHQKGAGLSGEENS
jgi:hypothetical protein